LLIDVPVMALRRLSRTGSTARPDRLADHDGQPAECCRAIREQQLRVRRDQRAALKARRWTPEEQVDRAEGAAVRVSVPAEAVNGPVPRGRCR
jgi:hypothetical protein